MESIAVTIKGIEDICAKEIKKILGSEGKKVCSGRVLFDSDNVEKLVRRGRSIERVYYLLNKLKFKKFEEIIDKAREIDFSKCIGKSFMVKCNREGEHDFKSIDIEKDVGEIIFERGYKVDLKNPETIVYVDIVNDYCFIGVLLTPNKLSKREYRIRINNQSVNACLAYSLLEICGWDKNKSLFDPFCKDGVIVIEAALCGGKEVYGYDSNPNNVKNAEINAKLASVKVEFKIKDEVDCIVTNPPFISKNRGKREIEEVYKEFFCKAEAILKGRMVIINPDIKSLKECARGFRVVEEREVCIGGMHRSIVVFEKSI